MSAFTSAKPAFALAPAAAALLLSACSALQIDVDVYKGALSNTKEIQTRQYATLAVAAQALVESLVDDHLKLDADAAAAPVPSLASPLAPAASTDVDPKQAAERQLERERTQCKKRGLLFLCQIADFYRPEAQRRTEALSDTVKDIPRLHESLVAALNARSATSNTPDEKVTKATRELNETLLQFAERVLYIANSEHQLKTVQLKEDEIALLQTLGNTLIVHANDLNRQEDRLRRLQSRAKAEKSAIDSAFVSDPTDLYDNWQQTLTALAQGRTPPAPAQAASGSTAAQPVTSTTDIANEASEALNALKTVRVDVLMKLNNQGEQVTVDQLRSKVLDQLKANKPSSEMRSEQAARVAQLLERPAFQPAPLTPPSCGETNPDRIGCADHDPVEIIDAWIASLRAKRVRALADGKTVKANDLLKAINVAYDQRTAMIYLRPASDYLSSVYSASVYQEGARPVYRNMLAEWVRYLRLPFIDEKKDGLRGSLEKLFWQNINRVTVNGGGNTNYALAKDDVGNWYVKAYSSDPEPVIKAATSLALFNSGAAINTNLLRRLEVQRKLDDPKLPQADKDRLGEELRSSSAPAEGAAFLKLRDRYAGQYQTETLAGSAALSQTLATLPLGLRRAIDAVDGMPSGCPAPLDAALQSLPGLWLDPPRLRLEEAQAKLLAARNGEGGKALIEAEDALRAGLTAVQLYANAVQRAFASLDSAACKEAWRAAASKQALSVSQAALITAASARRQTVQRYSDALSHIAEVASTQ